MLFCKDVEGLREKYPEGTRMVLDAPLDEPYSKLGVGDKGTVTFIDDAGNIHMSWDKGGSLSLLPNVDSFHVTNEE